MKKAFTCRACGKRDEFDTDTVARPLLESREKDPLEEVEFYVDCSHCGEKNAVIVTLPRQS
jgi:transcription elongation factor Elf1